MNGLLPIIDGDVLAYMSCKSRWDKFANSLGIIALSSDGNKIPLEITEEDDELFLEESWKNFKKLTEELVEKLFAEDFLMAVKGPDNFRNLLYPEYKLHRVPDKNMQSRFVPIIRKRAVEEGYAIESHGKEADDLIRIWAMEARERGQDYVVCSIDKDLKCIPGKYWDLKKNLLIHISEFDAMHLYYAQLLKGDATDNIPGIPGVGPVKADRILAECLTEDDFQEAVVAAYIDFYGDDWYSYLLSNGKMIHLQRTPTDYFMIRDWSVVKSLS